jgi:hypothetical protein
MIEELSILLIIFLVNVFALIISLRFQAGIFSLVATLFGTIIDIGLMINSDIPSSPLIQMMFLIIQVMMLFYSVTRR